MTFPVKLLRTWLLILLLSWLPASHAAQAYYTIPQDLNRSPFNCTYSADLYTCPSISLPQQTTLNVTATVKIRINGSFFAGQHFTTYNGPNGENKLKLDVSGSVTISQQSNVEMELKEAGGSVNIGQQSTFQGDIWTNGALHVGQHSLVAGNVDVDGDMTIDKKSDITGTCRVGGHTDFTGCGAPPQTSRFHHILIEHKPGGVTCMPSTIKIKACSTADSGGACTPYTGGVSGTIAAKGAAPQNLAFEIPDDSSETTVSLSSPVAATFTLSSPDTSYTCWNGERNDCIINFAQTAFVLEDITDHLAGTEKSSTISAVATKADDKTCQPAFTTTTPVTFRCIYNNPTSGSSVTLAFGSQIQTFACGTDKTMWVPFDSNGKASFKVTYPDVGNITLKASYGENMNGQDSFIAAPASFKLGAAKNPIRAGEAADVTVQALTIAGAAAKSFGLEETTPESVVLAFKRCQPSTDNPSDGVFSFTADEFNGGSATYTVKWTEVGNGDLTATLASGAYLGSAFSATGILAPSTTVCASGAKGALASAPHHFQTTTEQPVYTYSGQPMKVIVSAHALDESLTTNYFIPSSGTSQTVTAMTVGAWNGTDENPGGGSWDSKSIALADIKNGAERGKVTFSRKYTLGTKLTAPAAATIRVTDANATSSSGHEEVVSSIRNGRLRLSNAFGSVNQNLALPVMAQYWSGNSWILNADDNYTSVPQASLAETRTGAAGDKPTPISSLANGQGKITVGKPSSGTSGTVDVAVNLGDSEKDIACLPAHPDSTGNKQIWLRHTYGNCTTPADPSARATFGIYPGQTKRTIYVREAFN